MFASYSVLIFPRGVCSLYAIRRCFAPQCLMLFFLKGRWVIRNRSSGGSPGYSVCPTGWDPTPVLGGDFPVKSMHYIYVLQQGRQGWSWRVREISESLAYVRPFTLPVLGGGGGPSPACTLRFAFGPKYL